VRAEKGEALSWAAGAQRGLCYAFVSFLYAMSKLRVSVVQYLNTAPLVWGFTHGPLQGKYELSFTVPSLCAEALRAGTADVAILPSIELQRMQGMVVLPGMAIACKTCVRSLLVLAKGPIKQARRIALDRSSRSTQALVRILCAEHWKISPEFIEAEPDAETMLREVDAALVIGDPALRISLAIEGRAREDRPGELICRPTDAGLRAAGVEALFVYDVSGEWRRLTGLPSVLAFWAARREVATPEVVANFVASRDYGVARIAEISQEASRELGLPAASLEAYLGENIDFSMDEENRCGLERYFARSAALGLIPHAKPLEWAPLAAGVRAAK
jgi:chorismate dehydratase